MSFKYLYLLENVDHDLICLLMNENHTFMLNNCWILDHV